MVHISCLLQPLGEYFQGSDMWTAHGKWNKKWRPVHKLWTWVCTQQPVMTQPCTENPSRQSPVCTPGGMHIIYVPKSPLIIQKDLACSLPPNCSVISYWKGKVVPWHCLWSSFKAHSLGGQRVPELKKWCYRNGTNCLWGQSGFMLLSIQTWDKARHESQWAHLNKWLRKYFPVSIN